VTGPDAGEEARADLLGTTGVLAVVLVVFLVGRSECGGACTNHLHKIVYSHWLCDDKSSARVACRVIVAK
jgi:hypothetical protein